VQIKYKVLVHDRINLKFSKANIINLLQTKE
jgi:hypothetical protein